MHSSEILYPILALAAWTGLVLLLIPVARFRAGFRREVRADDFKFGESASVPPRVSLPNRNYMNLLEAPMLFYVVCVLLFVISGVTPTAVVLAWSYVALRIVHSLIHLTYNRVQHRLVAFAISNAVLAALWVGAGVHITHAGA
ncbi:MAPEG family protein [Ramlibacter sp. H39-3-26]|uniref:MAPEG family protein n=1 Tax=Curvibacter soli TaxID=3031331 RepID=UPI0023DA0419|nr:MAPEG family protein [Ramlibacter sp. H39-3-26]MDF1486569.1 MAPEG family protein [Ramlibacter sp. H39-3-26]